MTTETLDPAKWIVKSVFISVDYNRLEKLLELENPFEFVVKLAGVNREDMNRIAEAFEEERLMGRDPHKPEEPKEINEPIFLNEEITSSSEFSMKTKHLQTGEVKVSVESITFPEKDGVILTLACERPQKKTKVSQWISKLLKNDPELQIAEGLRRLKALVEVGEVATIEGQSSGRGHDESDNPFQEHKDHDHRRSA
jgi:hypothetical protein